MQGSITPDSVFCGLCPHNCRIKPGGLGVCKARTNLNGKTVSVAYGKLTALALDPIEKKPLNFFYPGSFILSVGSFGCNMRCAFCQNWEISTSDGSETVSYEFTPPELAQIVLSLRDRGNIGLAYTYNEPLINYEFVSDCAALIRENGMKNVLVSNGMMNGEKFTAFIPLMDAANIDLKSANPDFYTLHGGDLKTVKENITAAARLTHLEVTTLVIESVNDSEEEIKEIARFLSGIDNNIPLHLTPFYPRYRMKEHPPTKTERLNRLKKIAGKYLKRVVLPHGLVL
jgi:pyruvate formate lyase activating enzyme